MRVDVADRLLDPRELLLVALDWHADIREAQLPERSVEWRAECVQVWLRRERIDRWLQAGEPRRAVDVHRRRLSRRLDGLGTFCTRRRTRLVRDSPRQLRARHMPRHRPVHAKAERELSHIRHKLRIRRRVHRRDQEKDILKKHRAARIKCSTQRLDVPLFDKDTCLPLLRHQHQQRQSEAALLERTEQSRAAFFQRAARKEHGCRRRRGDEREGRLALQQRAARQCADLPVRQLTDRLNARHLEHKL